MRNNFKLSAVAVALATASSAHAVTLNDIYLDQYWGVSDPNTSQYVDLGSVTTPAVTKNGLAQEGKAYASYEVTKDGQTLIVETVDGKLADGTAFSRDNYDTAVLKKVGSGSAQDVTIESSETIKRINQNNVTYGEKTTQDSGVNFVGNEYDTNSDGTATSTLRPIDENFAGGNPQIVNDQSVSLGIINTVETKDTNGNITSTENIYGVSATNKVEGGIINETTLTAGGITTTGNVTASNVTSDVISLGGKDLATIIADGDADTLVAANNYTDTAVAAEAAIRADADAALQANIDAEAVTRANEDIAIRAELAAGDAATLAAANTYTDDAVAVEAAAREAGDQAIRDDIATKITTNELEVNGSVIVNNVKSTTTVDQAGTPATTPTFGDDVDADGKPDTLVQTKEQTDTVTVNSQSQQYNENNLTFSSKTQKGTQTTTDSYVADITYDENGVATYGTNVSTGQQITSDLDLVSEDTIIVGKEFDDSTTALTIRNKDANGEESSSVLTAQGLTTGSVTASTVVADSITLNGADLATTIADGDAATLVSANSYTDSAVAAEAITRANADTVLQANIDAEATTRANEDAAIRTELAAGDAATLASANTYTDNSVAAEAVTRANADTVLQANIDAEAVTRETADKINATAIAKEVTDRQAAITAEATARQTGDAQTLADAKAFTTSTATTTLNSAKSYTDSKATETLTAANAYTDTQVSRVSKKLDDVEKTSYRGIAIALAAQQQVPNIKPGQFAVFGGVGHYEGESAGALGLVSALADGRTSISAALGVAGSGEVGGRVGVAYVFGGN